MKYANTLKLSTLLVVFALFLTACGDDPVSADEDPPELPEFENIEADISYFQNNSQAANQENENFSQAFSYASSLSAITSSGMFYTSFFSSTSQSEAEFNNGEWRWEYSYSYEGESVSMVLTSREVGDNIVWEMNWSYSDGQGNSVEDYTIIEGTIAKDGSSGSWTFNDLNPDTNQEEPFLVTTWERSSETEYELVTEFYGDGSGTETYTFTQSGEIFDIVYSATNAEDNIYVHWETSSETGYYQVGTDTGNRYCWSDAFANVDCSTVGY